MLTPLQSTLAGGGSGVAHCPAFKSPLWSRTADHWRHSAATGDWTQCEEISQPVTTTVTTTTTTTTAARSQGIVIKFILMLTMRFLAMCGASRYSDIGGRKKVFDKISGDVCLNSAQER